MNKFILFLSILIIFSSFLYGEDIKEEEFVKKGWEYSLKQIKTAKVSYDIRDLKSNKLKRKCLWYYKDGKERLDVELLDENEKVKKKICYIGKEGKTISFSYKNNNAKVYIESIVSIKFGYADFWAHITPSTILFRIPFFVFSIEEAIKKFKLDETTSSYFKMVFYDEKNKISWDIFLSTKNFLPDKIIVKCPNVSFFYTIDYIEIEKIWFPVEVKLISKKEKNGQIIIKYQNIEINKKINDEIFNPEFPKGTKISDMTMGITYEVE